MVRSALIALVLVLPLGCTVNALPGSASTRLGAGDGGAAVDLGHGGDGGGCGGGTVDLADPVDGGGSRDAGAVDFGGRDGFGVDFGGGPDGGAYDGGAYDGGAHDGGPLVDLAR
jgi:hypothetical protein